LKKINRWLRHFTPEKHTRTGSIRGVLLIVLLIATYSGWYRIKWGHGNFLDILIAIGITLIIACDRFTCVIFPPRTAQKSASPVYQHSAWDWYWP
jgi:hypothetical protein